MALEGENLKLVTVNKTSGACKSPSYFAMYVLKLQILEVYIYHVQELMQGNR